MCGSPTKYGKLVIDFMVSVLRSYLWHITLICSFHFAQSNAGSVDCSDAQFSVQHLFRKLGHEEFIGQRIILAVSQKISSVSEILLLLDPFDDSFPDMHGNMFIM